jgi:hypothetical protein
MAKIRVTTAASGYGSRREDRHDLFAKQVSCSSIRSHGVPSAFLIIVT